MKKIQIDEHAEENSRRWIGTVYTLSMLGCFIIFVGGLIACGKFGFVTGFSILVFAIIGWGFSSLLEAMLNTIVNISSKLDYCEEILKKVERIEELHTDKISDKKCIETPRVNTPQNTITEEPKHNVVIIQDDEFNQELIDLINAGKELDARSLLIRKKNMSLSGAIAYIESLKNMTR